VTNLADGGGEPFSRLRSAERVMWSRWPSEQMDRTMAAGEAANHGIRVNVLLAGAIETVLAIVFFTIGEVFS
jgi:hypothetical protein